MHPLSQLTLREWREVARVYGWCPTSVRRLLDAQRPEPTQLRLFE